MMRMASSLVFTMALAFTGSWAAADTSPSCNQWASLTCKSSNPDWKTDGTTACSALHGGYKGNAKMLQHLMINHFRDSFKLMLTASHFDSDAVNRLGIHKYISGYSHKMWENGKKVLGYIMQRGGRLTNTLGGAHPLKLTNLTPVNSNGEVKALASTLDLVKMCAENSITVYRHALSKKHHTQEEAINNPDSFDPAIAHFLEEEFISEYAEDIRSITGNLNLLAKMTTNDKTKAMGLHLFDSHLNA